MQYEQYFYLSWTYIQFKIIYRKIYIIVVYVGIQYIYPGVYTAYIYAYISICEKAIFQKETEMCQNQSTEAGHTFIQKCFKPKKTNFLTKTRL